MGAMFEMTLPSELLEHDEIAAITGSKLRHLQIEWLKGHQWQFHTNRAGNPVVGRMYARLKLAGVNVQALAPGGWTPDFTGV